MLQRYDIFKHKELSLSEEEGTVHFTAIPEDAIRTGMVVPRSNPMLFPESIGSVEASTAEEAEAKYKASLEELWT